MQETLNDREARVIGCLIEKSIVTPDQYPMTLNALTNACNQKSSRNPVMSLSPAEVQQAIRTLESKHLVRRDENFKSRTEKYSQRFCGTRYSDLQFSDAETAIVCLLLLRGPQTPGELRTRSGRLHEFADNAEVVSVLEGLVHHDRGPLLVKLPRTPGRKDAEYMHLFAGPIDVDAYTDRALKAKPPPSSSTPGIAQLEERLAKLEAEVREIRAKLS